MAHLFFKGSSMSTVTLETAQAQLSKLIEQLQPGDTIVITQNEKPVAKLTSEKPAGDMPCKAGSYRKDEFWMAADFNAPLEEFKEYMEDCKVVGTVPVP
jgi:prevent-host-death family protein